MKLQTLLLIAVSIVNLYSCSSSSNKSSSGLNSVHSTGSYAPIDVRDADVQACADFAVAQQQPPGSVRLISINSAERQVVAGLNYKLSITISRDGTEQQATAVVWSKLDGTKELTFYRY